MTDNERDQNLPITFEKTNTVAPVQSRSTTHASASSLDIGTSTEVRDVLNQVAGHKPEAKTEEIFNYKGVEIRGLQFLEQQGILREDVLKLLDQLPNGYFDQVHLGTVVFEDFKYFIVERNDQPYEAREDEVLPTDKVSRRVRGQAVWNSQVQDGHRVYDGKQIVHVYSTLDWEGENDKDVALYTLAHELGHVTWNALDPKQGSDFWEKLRIPYDKNLPSVYLKAWGTLFESQLPRYLAYKADFLKEKGRYTEITTMEESDDDVARQEDFATAHEYFLYWHNLQQLDSDRYGWLNDLYADLGENGES